MTIWRFNSDLDGWSNDESNPSDFVWTSSGYSGGGLWIDNISGSTTIIAVGISEVCAEDDPFSFRVRVTATDEFNDFNDSMTIRMRILAGAVELGVAERTFPADPTAGYDSGWVKVSSTITLAGTATAIQIISGGGVEASGDLYIDHVYFRQTEDENLVNPLRLLKMDADGGTLYVTGVQGGTLSLFRYSLATLIVAGTTTFGTCSYTDPDNFTRGIFPVARPGGDGILYLYGRDANNVQVQYNDYNGTAGWVNVGAGTATWATTKYCVGLMPNIFQPDNLIAVFYDGAISMTDFGTTLWTAQGSVSATNLRTSARDQLSPDLIYVAGTAAGTLLQSVNYGNTFAGVGTASAGTINVIEVLN